MRITDAGRRAIEAAAPAHVAHVRRQFFDLLSDDEMITLTAVFERLLAKVPPETADNRGRRSPFK